MMKTVMVLDVLDMQVLEMFFEDYLDKEVIAEELGIPLAQVRRIIRDYRNSEYKVR